MAFRPERERSRRLREPALLLQKGWIIDDEHTMNSDDDPDNDDHCYPPTPKRSRIDEDNLLAEAVLACVTIVSYANSAPTTNQQAINRTTPKSG